MRIFNSKINFVKKTFESCKKACLVNVGELRSNLSNEYIKIGNVYHLKDISSPELLFLNAFSNFLEELTRVISDTMEKNLIYILPPLTNHQLDQIRTIINDHFDKAKSGFISHLKAVYASIGKEGANIPATFLERLDTIIKINKIKTNSRLEIVSEARENLYNINKRENYKNFGIGFVLGVISSVLATIIM